MKKFTAMMVGWVMMYNLSFAGFAIADDVNVRSDNTNNVDATGGNATATNTQGQEQGQDQDQVSSAVIYGNLPEVGFVGFLNPGTPIVGTEWKFYYSPLYARLSVKKIDKMRWGFHFLDLMPTKWGGRVQFTMEGEKLQDNQDDILVMNYWPEIASNPGDEVLGTSIVVGEPDWSDQAFLGEAAKACKDETMTRRIAISYSEYIDGITVGASIGMSGSTAEVSKGSGFVIASGAMVGKNKTRAERVRRVKVLCMNDGPLYLIGKKPAPAQPAPPVVVEKPCPPKACNPDGIWAQINELKRRIALCTQFCFNNLQLRSALGEKYIDLAVCTGDKQYLNDANKNFEIAERNYAAGILLAGRLSESDIRTPGGNRFCQ